MLRPMPAGEVREAWGWVRNGLLDVAARAKATWIPEDVYVAVQASQAHIYEIEDAGDALGFACVQKLADADGATLFVWALWSEPGALALKSGAVFAELDKLAQSVGTKRIRMHSPRKGWAKYMDAVSVIYEREM
jgi:hypothetical protein